MTDGITLQFLYAWYWGQQASSFKFRDDRNAEAKARAKAKVTPKVAAPNPPKVAAPNGPNPNAPKAAPSIPPKIPAPPTLSHPAWLGHHNSPKAIMAMMNSPIDPKVAHSFIKPIPNLHKDIPSTAPKYNPSVSIPTKATAPVHKAKAPVKADDNKKAPARKRLHLAETSETKKPR